MKYQKWLSVLFVVLALVIVSVLALPAQAAEESDLTFTLNADGQSYSVTACNTSASGELVIPSTHEGKPVTAIGDKAFYECYGLSYISIPDTVTSIGTEAFAFCDLPELTIPSSVVSIGSSAFYGNNNLIYNTFGNAKYLGNSENPYLALVQAENTEITECRILPETKIILGNAFYGCTNLSAITYCGTQEQWDAIAEGNNNAPLTDAALRFHNYENGLCTVCQKSGTCGENLTWTLDTAGTLTISGTGAMTDYGYDSAPWTDMRDAIHSVVIESGVTTIGAYAFYNCSSLQSITIPESVTTIGYLAFYGCTNLEEINFNATAMNDPQFDGHVFDYAGGNGRGITVNIGANVTRVPAYLFSCWFSDDCVPKIIKVVFAEGSACTSIGQQAFYNCAYLQSVTIGEKVTDIGDSAFAGCSALQGIWVDENNLAYSNDAYGVLFNKNKTKLIQAPRGISGNYEIPGSVTSIADSAFAGCAKLKGVTVPSTVTEIAYYTFGRCTALENVSLPNTLQTLGDAAFYRCESLQSIDVPDSVKAIGKSAFNTSGLKSFVIPEGVTRVAEYMFSKCYGLKSITIPEGVTDIDSAAFYWCTGLEEINFNATAIAGANDFGHGLAFHVGYDGNGITLNVGANVTRLPDGCFAHNEKLINVIFADGSVCESIGSSAFCNCTGLQNITLPDSVTIIGYDAFYGCANLEFNEYENAKYLGSTTNPYMYLVEAMSANSTEFTIHRNTKIIGYDAFAHCTSLQRITIPEGVTTIGVSAFYNCTSLQSIDLPEGVTTIGTSAFYNCTSLQSITIPEGVTTIGARAFDSCTGLRDVIIPNSIAIIDKGVFFGCSGLKSIVIPEGVTTIGAWAFESCTGLQSITIPNSVEAIGDTAFGNCTNLVCAFYSGTATQKAKIKIGVGNASLNGAWHYEVQKIQFCGQDCYYCGHCRKSMTLLGEDVKATVTFLDEDGTELYTQHCYFGEMAVNPVYPTKESDDAHNYVFAGWDKPVVQCTGDTTYTAKFVPVCVHYTVAFKNWDGSVISSITYHYGDTVIVPSAPLRPSDNQYTYTFDGWDKEITACTGDATYTATYLATDINYTVAFKNWNGAVLDYGTYHYGDVLNFPVVPNRPSDNKYTYTFAGWDSADTSCSGNAVYTAVFKQTEINYTVVFKNWDGTVISSKTYHYGDAVTAPSAPTRASDNVYSYTFDGWDKAVVDCSGNATYTALYKSAYRSYTVTFKNWDGTVLSTKTYHYGDTILAPSVPKRPNDSKYSYTYVGWDGVVDKCTGNATYTAVFTAQSLVPTTVTSTKHTVSGGTISKIGVGTTVSTLLGNLNERDYAKVYQGNNVVSGSALIGTGMEVKIMDGRTVKATATVVVTGDTNGDGKLTITDMLAAKAHVLKKNTLQGASSQAADTNGDGGISITDFIQMKAHILGKSTVEPKSAVTTVSVGVVLSGAVACAAEAQPVPQAETETVSAPAPVDVILPDKKLFALA